MPPKPMYDTSPPSNDPRAVEAWALGEASRRLAAAGRPPANADGLRAALMLNQRLWTLFQVAITEDDCPLPGDLRSNVAALSLLVDRETTARLVDLDGGRLDTLLSVNRAVAAGLTEGLAASPAATAIPAAGAGAAPGLSVSV